MLSQESALVLMKEMSLGNIAREVERRMSEAAVRKDDPRYPADNQWRAWKLRIAAAILYEVCGMSADSERVTLCR